MLELACGTGLFTRLIAPRVARLTAVDASPEVVAINRARVGADNVDYVQADLFAWRPMQRYDAVFFSFWLSHVPDERFGAFWEMVAAALAPSGAVYLIDSAFDPTSTAKNHVLPGREAGIVTRKLNDGREFRIVKLFYEPGMLAAKLEPLGWRAQLSQTARYFIHGEVTRPAVKLNSRVNDRARPFRNPRRRRTATAARGPCRDPLIGELLRTLVPPDRAAFALLVAQLGLLLQQLANEFGVLGHVMAAGQHHGGFLRRKACDNAHSIILGFRPERPSASIRRSTRYS